jgi:hypothetical protein
VVFTRVKVRGIHEDMKSLTMQSLVETALYVNVVFEGIVYF